jgi:hypothetical protein
VHWFRESLKAHLTSFTARQLAVSTLARPISASGPCASTFSCRSQTLLLPPTLLRSCRPITTWPVCLRMPMLRCCRKPVASAWASRVPEPGRPASDRPRQSPGCSAGHARRCHRRPARRHRFRSQRRFHRHLEGPRPMVSPVFGIVACGSIVRSISKIGKTWAPSSRPSRTTRPLHPAQFLDRLHVVHNARAGKYVCWL